MGYARQEKLDCLGKAHARPGDICRNGRMIVLGCSAPLLTSGGITGYKGTHTKYTACAGRSGWLGSTTKYGICSSSSLFDQYPSAMLQRGPGACLEVGGLKVEGRTQHFNYLYTV
jgi:hypothetical protein